MKIKFGSLVIHDFKAFKGRHTLVLNRTGVVYIVGENHVTTRLSGNGASKSSLWDALCWCLYGKTPRGLRNPDITPWRGGKPFVTVGLDIDDNEYSVQRSVGPNRFTINGKDAADIADILPISFDLFVNAILLPQGNELFLDKTPAEKMDLFTQTLQLDRWDTRSSAANLAVGKLEAELSQYLREATACKSALEEVQSILAEVQKKSKTWNDDNRGRTNASKGQIEELQKKLEARDGELSTAVLAEDGALTEKRAAEAALRDLRESIADHTRTIVGLEERRAAQKEQLDEAEVELAKLSTAKACPICGQAVKPANLAEHKKELARLIEENKVGFANRGAMLTNAKRALVSLRSDLLRIERDIARFTQVANDAEDARLRAKAEVTELEGKLKAARDIKQEENPHLQQISSLTKRKKAIEAELTEVELDQASATRELEQVKPWVKWFKDIKLQLIEDVLEELEFTANSMIEEVGLEDWQIRFDIEKEAKSGNVQRKIDVQISSPESNGFVRWESWSGGESGRLRLIGSLSLADVLLSHAGVETNLEILDEPAVYWSSEGVEELCAFLALRSKEQHKTIMYIEHQAVESTHFDETLLIVKDDNGARIEAR